MISEKTQETALVLGLKTSKNTRLDAQESFDEAKNLADTAGAIIVGEELIEIREFRSSTLIGSGKVDMIAEKIAELKPDVIIMDHELSPAQNRNLEEQWKVRVVDRTGLILDIFSQRAHSREGKLQVELAQLEYLFPRLVGAWSHLKAQQGGIGFRGPGETQLEVDRRRARERITFLKKSIGKVTSAREIHRSQRQSVPIPTLSLIGYTNAGKSTLFNKMTGASEFVEDKLFATLDPKTKRLKLPSGHEVLISDTVGFIRNLPHQLVESFKSTFEEVADSDLLLHVIDTSHHNRTKQIETVERLLAELKLNSKPKIDVMNKIDRVVDSQDPSLRLASNTSVVRISALTGAGVLDLLRLIERQLSDHFCERVTLLVPHKDGRIVSDLYRHGRVISSQQTEAGTVFKVDLLAKWKKVFEAYIVH